MTFLDNCVELTQILMFVLLEKSWHDLVILKKLSGSVKIKSGHNFENYDTIFGSDRSTPLCISLIVVRSGEIMSRFCLVLNNT